MKINLWTNLPTSLSHLRPPSFHPIRPFAIKLNKNSTKRNGMENFHYGCNTVMGAIVLTVFCKNMDLEKLFALLMQQFSLYCDCKQKSKDARSSSAKIDFRQQ